MEVLRVEGFFPVKVIKKLNRFVVLVERNGKVLKAHNTNTGRLKEFLVEGKVAYCKPHKGKKTDCRLFAVEDLENLGAVIDTSLQMWAFEEAFRKGFIPWLKPSEWNLKKRNALLGENSYIDYLFEERNSRRAFYLEIKSAAMRSPDNFGMYPDCPTERGQKHIRELINHREKAGILFICALPKVRGFKPYCNGDPEICELLNVAKRLNLPIRAISMHFNPVKGAIVLENPDLPVVID